MPINPERILGVCRPAKLAECESFMFNDRREQLRIEVNLTTHTCTQRNSTGLG